MGAKYIKSIAECSNTFDLHFHVMSFLSGLLRQVLLYTIKLNGYPIWDF